MTMRIAILCVALMGQACATPPPAAPPRCERELIVRVTGVAKAIGRIPVALWKSKATFLRSGDWVAAGSAEALAPETTVHLGVVPCGRYALSAFHDRLNAGTLRRGLFGVPRDPWAFSAPPQTFGPPTFEQAAFDVEEGDGPMVMELRLIGGADVAP